jgi:catalase
MGTDGKLGGNVKYEPDRFGDFAQDSSASELRLAAGAVGR